MCDETLRLLDQHTLIERCLQLLCEGCAFPRGPFVQDADCGDIRERLRRSRVPVIQLTGLFSE